MDTRSHALVRGRIRGEWSPRMWDTASRPLTGGHRLARECRRTARTARVAVIRGTARVSVGASPGPAVNCPCAVYHVQVVPIGNHDHVPLTPLASWYSCGIEGVRSPQTLAKSLCPGTEPMVAASTNASPSTVAAVQPRIAGQPELRIVPWSLPTTRPYPEAGVGAQGCRAPPSAKRPNHRRSRVRYKETYE